MTAIPDGNKVVYQYLGRSGLRMANLCLGAMTFGHTQFDRPGQCDEDLFHQILNRYREWGRQFHRHGKCLRSWGIRGDCWQVAGKVWERLWPATEWKLNIAARAYLICRQSRENFIIATKVRQNMGTSQNINNEGLSRRHIIGSIDRSLERLRTDYVDLYQTHIWDDASPLEETLKTLDDLVRAGKVRYVGASNVTGWQMQKMVCTSEKLGLNPLVSLQQQYSLVSRDSELEPFQVCKAAGIGVLPWSPLKGGLLSGKFKRGVKPTEGHMGWVADNPNKIMQVHPSWKSIGDKTWEMIEAAEVIAKRHSKYK